MMDNITLGEPDPRTKDWALAISPSPLLLITACYLLTVSLGPKLMRHRQPFSLRPLLLVYNLGQVILSAYIFKEFVASSYLAGYQFACQHIDPAPTPLAMRMANACWWFYLSKYIDLLDSVFFVLRKKGSQLSFLHVYHHCTMPFNWYVGVRYIPGGQAFFSGLCNSLVHVVMYSYYFLSVLGPRVKPYLWWKKYLTQLQMIQFVAVMTHLVVGLYNNCQPRNLQIWTVVYTFSLLLLFAHFYKVAYRERLLNAAAQKNGNANHINNGSAHVVVKGRKQKRA